MMQTNEDMSIVQLSMLQDYAFETMNWAKLLVPHWTLHLNVVVWELDAALKSFIVCIVMDGIGCCEQELVKWRS